MEIATATKVATVVVKNKDKIGKGVLYSGVAIFSVFIILNGLFFYIMSAFMPDGILKTSDYFDGEESAIFQSIQSTTAPFYQDLEEKMKMQRELLVEEKTYTYDIENDEGETLTVEKSPKVTIRVNYVPESSIIAFLLMSEGIDTETAIIDKEKISEFLTAVCSIKEIAMGDFEYILETEVLSDEQIADIYFQSEVDRNTFLTMCSAYEDYFAVAVTKVITDEGSEGIDSVFSSVLSDVPLYLQYDTKWATVSYGNGKIKKTGCCPTCLAMVFSYLCQKNIYPDEVSAWAGDCYYVNGYGTSWNIFSPAATAWNVKCTNIGKNQKEMIAALKGGKIIIASMGPGTFTKGGHFIVLSGITEDGRIKVNDPNDNGKKQHINKEFDVSLILRESKNMWVFER